MIKKYVKNILVTSIIVVLFLQPVYIVSAEENQDIVDAEITINMNDGTNLSVSTEITVIRIYLEASGRSYTGSDIENEIAGTEKMGAIKYHLRSILLNQLKHTFENAKINPIDELPAYQNSKFFDSFNINLISSYFEINESIDAYEFINGILDMNGKVDYIFNLQAEEGWNNSYKMSIGGSVEFETSNGNAYKNIIEWNVLNELGAQPSKVATMTLRSANPTSQPNSEKIYLYFNLNTKKPETSLKASVYSDIINISSYNIIPDFISNIDYLTADGIRLFVDNKILDWNETIYKNTFKQIHSKIKENIEKSNFNQSLNLEVFWDKDSTINCKDPFNLEDMDEDPPIILDLIDSSVDLKIADISSKAVYGLLNTGGIGNISKEDIDFGKNLQDLGYPYNITISFPKNISLNDQNSFTWNKTITFEGELKSKRNPDYKEEEIHNNIEIRFKNSDLNLLGFFTNNPELNFDLEIDQNKKTNVTKIPKEFSIPKEISINYLNSDAIRLCIQENVFSENEVNGYLSEEKNIFEERISKIITNLKIKGKIDKEAFNKNIEQKINISNMNKKPPMETHSFSNTIYPMSFDFSVIPPSFNIPIQEYVFSGIKNQSITYKIVFPSGIDINVDDTLDKVNVKENKNKQDVLEVSFTKEEYNLSTVASVKMTPSTLFLIGVFMPCIISFFIVLILIAVILMFRRRRKYKKPSGFYKEEQMEDSSGYEEENYYVPPPPGSK